MSNPPAYWMLQIQLFITTKTSNMKAIIIVFVFFMSSSCLFAQDGNKPVFAVSDNLNEFGDWQSTQQLTVKGKENVTIPMSVRHKIIKKQFLTCKFTVEIRNDSDKDIKFYYLAGNSRTNYYAGSAGAIREKVKLKPGEVKEINYPLPTKNFKAADDAETCRKCKELEHLYMIGDLELN